MTSKLNYPTVGILGGGQLGRMLALEAARLGVRVRFYQPEPSGPSQSVGETFIGASDDAERIAEFLEGCDVVTLENEWVDLSVIASECESRGIPLWPTTATLGRIADKIVQKDFARSHDIPVGPYFTASDWDALQAIVAQEGYPLVLKSPTHGYDGYGTASAKDEGELREAFERFSNGTDGPRPVLVETHLPFVRELSVLVARRPGGETVTYPTVWTRQENHRCAAVELPAPVRPEVEARAREVATAAAEAFEAVGILAVELFEMPDGSLFLNEVAPRPHNSGHITMEACRTSQFENHLRAVLDWPLGSTLPLAPSAVMVNLLGEARTQAEGLGIEQALDVPGARVHIYGKLESRPSRKMGHVTVVGDDMDDVRARAEEAAKRIHL